MEITHNLSHYRNPFDLFGSIFSDINSPFELDHTFPTSRRLMSSSMRLNMNESDTHYNFKVYIPGVTKDTLEINYDPETNVLALSAEHKDDVEETDAKNHIIRHEVTYGKMHRSFILPDGVDGSILAQPANQPKLINGVLTFKLEKPKYEKPKDTQMRIDVQ